jgi:starch synthase (maltosyl-transferring)
MTREGRQRVVIEGVEPEIDGGQYPIKRTVGEKVVVEADAFTDGHDLISCLLLWRPAGTSSEKKGQSSKASRGSRSSPAWQETPMQPLVNDRWRGEFSVNQVGRYQYTIMGWVDPFKTWRYDLKKRVAAGQDVSVDLLIGANLIEETSHNARGLDAENLKDWVDKLRRPEEQSIRAALAQDEGLALLMARCSERRFATRYDKELTVVVDRVRARFSTWYELFPRSFAGPPGSATQAGATETRHGTFKDLVRYLPDLAAMGFDVLYLPPIHPIGERYRKGKNNSPSAEPGDVGSPWGIGSKEGGHTAIHSQLGTLEDFRQLVAQARELGIDLALDIAFQCSPDHPWVKDHPDWFRHRPDGTIQYAENPPKKYQDIYPLDFESEDWQGLWEELKGVFLYWIEQGVSIFRVDNPHTKAFPFWEWAIDEIKSKHPEVIFLSEAFTRPKVMYRLAKLGFTQSYTYFAWRNNSWELREYFTELTQTKVREFFRANLWPNTPDILTEYLQIGGRPAFVTRLVLAATLGANYGMYGPAFELCEHVAVAPGKEEYVNSEKYEIKHWDLERPDSLREMISLVNHIRKQNPALHCDHRLVFHDCDNPQLICYSKHTEERTNVVVTIVNLDPYHTQSGWVTLSLEELGVHADQPYQLHDLLGDGYYLWHGATNYVELNPHIVPAHIFRIRHRVRTERDFEYYL